MRKLLIWGAGDQGLVTLDCALAANRYDEIDFMTVRGKASRRIPGYKTYEEENGFEKIIEAYDEVIVATGSNAVREAKISKLLAMGIPLATVIHPTAVISPEAEVSEGCIVLANTVININARIGIGCIINNGAVVEHDCRVGAFVNVCPKVSMAGHTEIGANSFLGIGCTIIDQIKVGKETTIGAGAVVIRHVPDYAVAVGVPAKIIKIKNIP